MGDTNTDKLPSPEEILGSTGDGEALPTPEEILGPDAKKKVLSAPLPSVSEKKLDQPSPEAPGSIYDSLLEDATSKSTSEEIKPTKLNPFKDFTKEPKVISPTKEQIERYSGPSLSIKPVKKTVTPEDTMIHEDPNELTSTEKKQELESTMGESGMVANRPQVADVTKPINPSEEELNLFRQATNAVTKGNSDEHYWSLVNDYLKNQYLNDPTAFFEKAKKLSEGADDEYKNSIVIQAFNNHAQILQKDQGILDARGADKDFNQFMKLQQQAEDLNAQYKDKPELRGEYEQKFNDVIAGEQLLLQDPKIAKNIQDYRELLVDGNKLGQAQIDYVKHYPDVVKRLKEQKEADEESQKTYAPGSVDAIVHNNKGTELLKNSWNSVVDYGSKFLEMSKYYNPALYSVVAADKKMLGIDDLTNFTDAHLKFITSNVPVINADGSLNYSRILPTLSKNAADIAMLMVGAGVIGSGAKALGIGEKVAEGTGLFSSNFIQTFPDYKKQAMATGMSEKDASIYALSLAGSTSALWAIAPTPMKKLLGDLMPKVSDQVLKGFTSAELKTLSSQSVMQKASSALKELLKGAGETTSLMFMQKMTDNAAGYFANKLNTDEKTKLQQDMTRQDVEETIFMGLTMSTLFGGVGQWQNKKAAKNSALFNAATSYESFKNQLEYSGFDKEKTDQIKKEVDQTVFALAKMPEGMSDAKKESLIPLITKKLSIEEQKKGSDKSFHEKFDRQIEGVDAEIKKVLATKLEKPTEDLTGDIIVEPKTETNDSKDNTGLPSENGIGKQEPEQTGTEQKSSSEEIKTGGIFQAPEENNVVENTALPKEGEVIPPVENIPTSKGPEEPEKKVHKLAQRWIDSTTLPDEMKEGMKKMGINYIPKGEDVTLKQAKEIVNIHEQADNLEGLENMAKDFRNDMEPDVRAVVLAELNQKYVSLSHDAVDPQTKEFYRNKAISIALYAAKDLTLSGRKINNAGKIWKRYLQSEPEGANIALQKTYDESNGPMLKGKEKTITDAKKVIDDFIASPEFEKLVGEKVKSAMKENAGKKNIFTRTSSERKAKIAELKDRLNKLGPKLTSGGIDPERLEIYVELGAEYIADGITTFAKWSKKMIDAGLTAAQAKDIWAKEKVSNDHDVTLENFATTKEKEIQDTKTPEQIAKEKDAFISKFESKFEGLKPDEQKKLLGDVFEELMKAGALTEDRFKQLFAKALGLKYIDEETANALRGLQERIIVADKAGDEYLKNPTQENAKILKKAMYDARLANSDLSKYFQRPSNGFDLMSAFIQGNLLTTTSSVQNVVYNIMRAPTTMLINASSSAMDYLLSKAARILGVTKLEGRSIDYIQALKGYFPGMLSGAKEGFRQLKTGGLSDDYHAREMHAGIHPLDALTKFYGGLTGKEKQKFGQQLANLGEGILGISPEVMFRILNLGDKPFRRGAENARLSEIIGIKLNEKKADLIKKEKAGTLNESEKQTLSDIRSGKEREKQMLVPDEDTIEAIQEAGLMATYQNENPLYAFLKAGGKAFDKATGLDQDTKLAKTVKGVEKVALTTVAPYINTPLNIGMDAVLLANPAIALASSMAFAIKGNRRASTKMLATAFVGYTIAKASQYLISANVITPGDKDDDKKTRDFKHSQGILANRFNWSLYQRIMAGKSNDGWKPGDFTFDYSNTGIVGMVMQTHAEMAKGFSDKEKASMGFFENQGRLLNASMRGMFDKSFFAGTNTLINSWVQGGDATDKWLVQTSSALKAIVLPNTLAKVSNINSDFIKETRDEDVWQTIKNNFKNQLFMGGDLPRKVTPWGEYIPTTPTDRRAIMYQLFDFSKGADIPADSFGEQIYKLWKRTDSQYVIPSSVDNHIQIGDHKVALDPKQYEQLQVEVGQARKSLANWYMTTPDWTKANDESKIKALQDIYSQGYNVGLSKYKFDHGLDLKTRKRKAKYEVNRSAIKNKAAQLEKE